jgi:hypothetical protein
LTDSSRLEIRTLATRFVDYNFSHSSYPETLNIVSPKTTEQLLEMYHSKEWREMHSLKEFRLAMHKSACIAFHCELVLNTNAATEIGLACCNKILDASYQESDRS